MSVHFVKSIPYEKLPYIKIYITSEKNSYGVVRQSWWDGNVKQALLKKNMFKQLNLKPQHTIYQNKASNCRAESYYECFERMYLTNTENCSNKCTGYSLPSLPN